MAFLSGMLSFSLHIPTALLFMTEHKGFIEALTFTCYSKYFYPFSRDEEKLKYSVKGKMPLQVDFKEL